MSEFGEMSKLNKLRVDRVKAWCSFNGWTNLQLQDEQ